jgi:hypothetical protein
LTQSDIGNPLQCSSRYAALKTVITNSVVGDDNTNSGDDDGNNNCDDVRWW